MLKQKLLTSVYLFLLLIFATGHLASAETTGTFTVVKGDVQVTSAGGATEKAKVGKKVNPSDVITAGPDSRAKIVMADKNVINISPETKMALEKYVYDPASDNKQVTLNVVYGKVRATVEQKYDGEKNKFHIKTPAAVAGVRGTDFLTSYSAKTKETKIVTFEGRVAVGMPGPGGQIINPVFVTPGQMTVATQGVPPAPPVAVPAEEFKKVSSESQAEPNKTESAKPEPNAPQKEEKPDDKKDDGKKADSAQNEEPKKSDAAPADEAPKKENVQADEPAKKDSAKADEPKKEEPRQADNSKSDGKPGKPGDTKADKGPASEGKREPASTAAGGNPPAPGAAPSPGGPELGKAPPPPNGTMMPPPAPGTMMLDRTDLAPTISRDVMTPTLQNARPVMNNFTPYVPPAQATQNYINQVNQIIQNSNTQSKVNIIIKRAP